MMSENEKERWNTGSAYEQYVGRWSRRVAVAFLDWLAIPVGQGWVDVGCGTGGLVATILTRNDPDSVIGIDRSENFLADAHRRVTDRKVRFQVGDAMKLPMESAGCDVAVSGLVLNFVAEPDRMVQEMCRVTKAGGIVAVYVWDYAGEMEMMRHFWDAAIEISPQDAHFNEGNRFPLCHPDALQRLWEQNGLTQVSVRAIDIQTVFRDFEDYWTPFLGGQGPAPTYLNSLSPETQERIRALLPTRLIPTSDGRIALRARAWAVQGRTAPEG